MHNTNEHSQPTFTPYACGHFLNLHNGPKCEMCQLQEAREINAALLAACKSALSAFTHNAAIDWSELEAAINKAEA